MLLKRLGIPSFLSRDYGSALGSQGYAAFRASRATVKVYFLGVDFDFVASCADAPEGIAGQKPEHHQVSELKTFYLSSQLNNPLSPSASSASTSPWQGFGLHQQPSVLPRNSPRSARSCGCVLIHSLYL